MWCISSLFEPCYGTVEEPNAIEPKLYPKLHGPIYSFCLGNQRFVILSDPSVVKDLLVSQSAVFSSRKDFYIKSRTILAGRGITAAPYDAKWQYLLSSGIFNLHVH